VSVLSESVPLCVAACEYATRLLDELGWHGVAMVEFKRDVRDAVPKLMEINGRFWGSLQLAVDAGVNFPALLVEGVRRSEFGPQAPYRIGLQNRWLWGDVDALLLRLFTRSTGARMMPVGRMRAVLDFLKFFGRDLHYENPKLDDIAPWLYESYRWLRIAFGFGAIGGRAMATPSPAPQVAWSERRVRPAGTSTTHDRS
jgi:hypothetical protein